MKKLSYLTLLVAALGLIVSGCEAPTSPEVSLSEQSRLSSLEKATTFTSSTTFPIDIFVFVPCALGGVGEEVHLTGDLHDLFHITLDSSGGVHIKVHDNPQGVSGVGLTSGDKYQATGVTQFEANAKGLPSQFTFVNNFRIIGQGPGNNFLVHDNFHVTVNANGTVTAVHDNFRVECK